MFEHKSMDSGLRYPRLPATFAHRDHDSRWTGDAKHFIGDEVIRQDHVRGLQQVYRTDGEKFWIARTRADQINGAWVG
jgi:hypothetical protein